MTASITIALFIGILTLLFQFFILRISGEKQRCEGRILLLLDKMADQDLEKEQALGATLTHLLSQKTQHFQLRQPVIIGETTPGQRAMLNILFTLEKRRAYLDKLVISLFSALTVTVLLLFYIMFTQL